MARRTISGARFRSFLSVLLKGLSSFNQLEPSTLNAVYCYANRTFFFVPNMQSLRPYQRSNEIQIRKDKTEKSANYDAEYKQLPNLLPHADFFLGQSYFITRQVLSKTMFHVARKKKHSFSFFRENSNRSKFFCIEWGWLTVSKTGYVITLVYERMNIYRSDELSLEVEKDAIFSIGPRDSHACNIESPILRKSCSFYASINSQLNGRTKLLF